MHLVVGFLLMLISSSHKAWVTPWTCLQSITIHNSESPFNLKMNVFGLWEVPKPDPNLWPSYCEVTVQTNCAAWAVDSTVISSMFHLHPREMREILKCPWVWVWAQLAGRMCVKYFKYTLLDWQTINQSNTRSRILIKTLITWHICHRALNAITIYHEVASHTQARGANPPITSLCLQTHICIWK